MRGSRSANFQVRSSVTTSRPSFPDTPDAHQPNIQNLKTTYYPSGTSALAVAQDSYIFRPATAEFRFNDKVLTRIREIEQEMAAEREKARIILPIEYQITTEPMDTPYSPTTFGRRMWCICGNIPIRIAFIAFIKQLVLQARDIRLAWARGDFSRPFPPGLFPPCPPRLANLMPTFLKRAIAGTH